MIPKLISNIDENLEAQRNGFKDAEHQRKVVDQLSRTIELLYGDQGGKHGVHTGSYLFVIGLTLNSALVDVERCAPHHYDSFIRNLLDTIEATRAMATAIVNATKDVPAVQASTTPPKEELN